MESIDVQVFISQYLIPAIDSVITDGDLRRTIHIAIDEAEKVRNEME